MKTRLMVAALALAVFAFLAAPAYAVCPSLDGKYEIGRGWEGTPAPGVTVSGSSSQILVTVAAGYRLDAVCVKTGGGEDVAGHFTISPSLPAAGPVVVTIRSTGVSSSGLSHITLGHQRDAASSAASSASASVSAASAASSAASASAASASASARAATPACAAHRHVPAASVVREADAVAAPGERGNANVPAGERSRDRRKRARPRAGRRSGARGPVVRADKRGGHRSARRATAKRGRPHVQRRRKHELPRAGGSRGDLRPAHPDRLGGDRMTTNP